MRGLREGRYDSWIETYRETGEVPTVAYTHSTRVLLYRIRLKQFTNQGLTADLS
jgi:ribosomal protein L25 (general stress protein Ctc)